MMDNNLESAKSVVARWNGGLSPEDQAAICTALEADPKLAEGANVFRIMDHVRTANLFIGHGIEEGVIDETEAEKLRKVPTMNRFDATRELREGVGRICRERS